MVLYGMSPVLTREGISVHRLPRALRDGGVMTVVDYITNISSMFLAVYKSVTRLSLVGGCV
jgi:hypothetical protein